MIQNCHIVLLFISLPICSFTAQSGSCKCLQSLKRHLFRYGLNSLKYFSNSSDWRKSKLRDVNPGESTIYVSSSALKSSTCLVVCFPLSILRLISPVCLLLSGISLIYRLDLPTPEGPAKPTHNRVFLLLTGLCPYFFSRSKYNFVVRLINTCKSIFFFL